MDFHSMLFDPASYDLLPELLYGGDLSRSWRNEALSACAPCSMDVLLVLSPGTCCGAAESEIGKFASRNARELLQCALKAWQGGVVIIDDYLSEELAENKAYNKALHDALLSARQRNPHPLAVRMTAEVNPSDEKEIAGLATRLRDAGIRATYHVTGAWYYYPDGGGCVGAAVAELGRLGYDASVHVSTFANHQDNW